MQHMAGVVPAADARNLQQFLTHSQWEARAVMDQVAQAANAVLGDAREACLLPDESGFAKLAHFLPRRDVDETEVIRQTELRHRLRKRAIQSHARCAKAREQQAG